MRSWLLAGRHCEGHGRPARRWCDSPFGSAAVVVEPRSVFSTRSISGWSVIWPLGRRWWYAAYRWSFSRKEAKLPVGLVPDGSILREQPGEVCAEEQVAHGCARAARGQPQQTADLVVGQHQLARLVGDDQPLTHGAQRHLVMLVLAGNDCGLQTEGLPVYPIRDEQRPGDSHPGCTATATSIATTRITR
jgi:hypothetical protein